MADPELLSAAEACVLLSSGSGTSMSDICDKGSEILRKMADRVPAGALGKAKSYRHLIAIELACRLLNVPFTREKLLSKCSNVSTLDFSQAVNNCKSSLRLVFTKTAAIDVLCVQFGGSLRAGALDVLREYHDKYVSYCIVYYRIVLYRIALPCLVPPASI
jgi:hypothetical protein